jgi:hypothetical protein
MLPICDMPSAAAAVRCCCLLLPVSTAAFCCRSPLPPSAAAYITMPEPVPVVVCVPASVPIWVPVAPCLALNSLVRGTASLAFCHACWISQCTQVGGTCEIQDAFQDFGGKGVVQGQPGVCGCGPACKIHESGGRPLKQERARCKTTCLVQRSPSLGGVSVFFASGSCRTRGSGRSG